MPNHKYKDEACSICHRSISVMDNSYYKDDEHFCFSCLTKAIKDRKVFIPHIPKFCSGFSLEILEFVNPNEIFDRIKTSCNRLNPEDNYIIVYDENYIMIQSLKKSSWYVKGIVTGYDLVQTNIPHWNAKIYNDSKEVVPEKLEEMLKGKTIIMV